MCNAHDTPSGKRAAEPASARRRGAKAEETRALSNRQTNSSPISNFFASFHFALLAIRQGATVFILTFVSADHFSLLFPTADKSTRRLQRCCLDLGIGAREGLLAELEERLPGSKI